MRRLIIVLGIIGLSAGIGTFFGFGPGTSVLGGSGCPVLEVEADAPNDGLNGWYSDAVNAPIAWQHAKQCEDIIVAIIDSGVDVIHPSLQGHLWTNELELNGQAGIDDDANGCVDDVHGCYFSDTGRTGSLVDEDGHGTMVTGVVASIAPEAQILMVKVDDVDELLAEPLRYAVDQGARVINLSWGFDSEEFDQCRSLADWEDEYPDLAAGLAYALDRGVIVTVAAGNGSSECIGYPGIDPRVLTVAATEVDANGHVLAPFSSYGPGADLAAPGDGIVTTIPTNETQPCDLPQGLGIVDGTSFSAPQVAGLVALVLADNPELGEAEVIAAIKDSVQHVRDGGSIGAIDMAAALGHPEQPLFSVRPEVTCTFSIENESTLDIKVFIDGEYVGTVDAFDTLRVPSQVYGQRAQIRLEFEPIITLCPWNFYSLCERTVDPFKTEVCMRQPFRLNIVETATTLRVYGGGCDE